MATSTYTYIYAFFILNVNANLCQKDISFKTNTHTLTICPEAI